MKARKFWKKVLRIRTLVIAILVIVIGAFTISYFGYTLSAHTIELDNMDFSTDGFTDFNTIDESKINRCKKVSENDKYVLFMDEKTTILTVALKDSLKAGEDKNLASSYAKVYQTANPDSENEKTSNFSLSFSSSSITNIYSGIYNAYENSVKFKNELTNSDERHYEIKYLTKEKDGRDAVQVYYTIGNFGSISAYFPKRIYTTVYEPSRCLYSDDDSYNEALQKYQDEYLSQVGSLANTFEDRFRGNVIISYQTGAANRRTVEIDGVKQTIVVPTIANQITVYSQKARDYLINVAFKELNREINAENGITNEEEWEDYYPIYSEEDIEELDKSYKNPDADGNPSWRFIIKDPELRLITYGTEAYRKYFNNSDSPLTNNPFMLSTHYNNIFQQNYTRNNPGKYTDDSGNEQYYNAFRQSNVQVGNANRMYALLYETELSYTSVLPGEDSYPIYKVDENGEYVPLISGGYVARDEEGNYIYDEKGNVTRAFYTTEQVAKDNLMFGTTTAGLPLFKIALDFELTDTGLNVTIPKNSLVDSSTIKKDDPDYEKFNVPFYITGVQILNNMTVLDSSYDGYIIVPDGSGAVINFNNGKNNTVAAPYYGSDQAYVKGTNSEEAANLMLGMFAFVNTTSGQKGGMLGIIEKGGGQLSLTASTVGNRNLAYFSASLRSSESVKTGTVSDSRSFPKYDKILSPSDIAVKYVILSEDQTDYSTIAKLYQDYLIKRDNLEFKDNTNQTVTDLTFLGTYEKYALFLGVKYKTPDTLTTFDQAMEIIDDLQENNVTGINASYTGWTNEYLEYEVGGSLKVAGVLGKTASMRKFYEYCVEKQIPFYPELMVTSTKGYDYLIGSSRYSTRGVGNEEAVHYTYDLATGRKDKKLSKTYTIAPQYYKDITEKLLKQYNKLNVSKNASTKDYSGFYLSDLGNQYAGNYRKNKQVYGAEAIKYQMESLDAFKENGNIKLSAPYDYAFKYIDTAINVPVNSKMYTVYDYSIPFYQLVVSGLFDYTTEQINGQTSRPSKWYFAKALESGSNFSYLLTAEDPAVLLETDYTQYYQAYYKNWRDTIISFTTEMNKLGIQECILTNHEFLETNLAKVTYTHKTNGTKIVLIVNIAGTTKTYNGQQIAAYSYIKEA